MCRREPIDCRGVAATARMRCVRTKKGLHLTMKAFYFVLRMDAADQ
jgi:hypothetical protein